MTFRAPRLPVSRGTMLALAAAVLAGLLALGTLGLFAGSDHYFHDLFLRIRGVEEPPRAIFVAAIDDKTLGRLGRWPLPRRSYADLLDRLREARVVAFDILMPEPSLDDARLAAAARRHGRAVFPIHIAADGSVHRPVPPLPAAPAGHVHIEPDADGVVRGGYRFLSVGSERLPSFSAVIAALAEGRSLAPERSRHGGARRILQSAPVRIDYAGGPQTFEHVSLIDILDGVYPSSYFQDRIALVGITAEGLGDKAMTPFSGDHQPMAGVEVQANLVATLMAGAGAATASAPLCAAALAVFAGLLLLIFQRLSEKMALLAVLPLLAAAAVADYVLFIAGRIWMPPTVFLAAVPLLLGVVHLSKIDGALRLLDASLAGLLPYLRFRAPGAGTPVSGLSGLLSSDGIEAKVALLHRTASALRFEKDLSEQALMSDLHGVFLFGPDGRAVLVNALAESLSQENGLDAQACDRLLSGLAPHLLEGVTAEELAEQVHRGTPETRTLALPKPAKGYFRLGASMLSMGGDTYTLLLLSDVTKIKELELLKSHVVSIVSHELKTPLTSIQGFSEILAGALDGKMKNFAEVIHRESERLARFLNTFLDITRIEEGRQPFKTEPVVLAELVRDVAASMTPIGAAKQIAILAETNGIEASVDLDRDITKQCLVNLVENAVKYSPAERTVRLRLRREDGRVAVDVVDQGFGIPKEELDRVFDKFFRSASEATKGIKGSGLGLAFVKEAVEAQGGTLALDSVYGEGTTFTVAFPEPQVESLDGLPRLR